MSSSTNNSYTHPLCQSTTYYFQYKNNVPSKAYKSNTVSYVTLFTLSFFLIFPVTFIYHTFCLEFYYINLTDKFPIHFCPKFSKIFHISLLPASNYRITHIPLYLHLELIVTCMFMFISIKQCNTILNSSFFHTFNHIKFS